MLGETEIGFVVLELLHKYEVGDAATYALKISLGLTAYVKEPVTVIPHVGVPVVEVLLYETTELNEVLSAVQVLDSVAVLAILSQQICMTKFEIPSQLNAENDPAPVPNTKLLLPTKGV